MVVVTLLAFNFGDNSSLVIDLDTDYIYFVGFLSLFALHHEPMFIYSWLSIILSRKYFSRI